MDKIKGLEEAFVKAKQLFMTTFSNGEEHTRVMTNFNESPYVTMWFPTEKKTRKVNDIMSNPKVVLTFPSKEKGKFWEIEGKAELASDEEVRQKWEWWWLYWHPAQRDKFWFPKTHVDPNRAIINISPESARLVDKT